MQNRDLTGLTIEEVNKRKRNGEVNIATEKGKKTIGDIFKDNFITYFNILNLFLAIAILAVGSYQNCTFVLIALANAVIGTIQEIRAKKSVEKLTLLTSPQALVVRNSKRYKIDIREIVKDDLLIIHAGDQISADSKLIEGEIEVDESLLTGEPDLILKKAGDVLLSGSAAVSGECFAKVIHVGDENYCETITGEAKRYKKPSSEIMKSLNALIKTISAFILPIGLILFIKQFFLLGDNIANSVTSAVAAMIGMIPEGLILLTSLVFAASVIRFSRKKTLVREMYGIEQLARVDVLCLDKTGTITEGRMEVKEILPLNCKSEMVMEDLSEILGALSDNNPTFNALLDYAGTSNNRDIISTVPFSSDRKWSAASFSNKTVVMGAEEYVLKGAYPEICERIKEYADNGFRVLIIAVSKEKILDRELPNGLEPEAIVVLSDIIKDDAAETISFFTENGVDVKIISGDSAHTVYGIAKRAKIKGCERYINVNELTDEELEECADKYTIFGRVLPEQKKKLIIALKKKGHKTAMIGDGVNDVLALREADCSAAMASGSSAAGSVAQFILLDSKLSSLYTIVMEGRRAINNIQRSASLFLSKTIYSFLLSAIFMFVPLSYPFKPIQLTLISAIVIGIPSFILAMEPNKSKLKGDFMKRIITTAIPAALVIVIHVLISSIYGSILDYNTRELSTIATLLTASVGFTMIISISLPFNKLRAALLGFLLALFAAAVYFFGTTIFMLSPISVSIAIFTCIGIVYGTPLFLLFKKLSAKIYDKSLGFLEKLRSKKRG